MAASSAPAKSLNTIEGDRELTVRICDITAAGAMLQRVLELGERAAKIGHVCVDTASYFRAREKGRGLECSAERGIGSWNESTADTKMDPTSIAALLCAPITAILTTITSRAGSLTSLTWPASSHTDRRFTRPLSFWEALYTHAPSLEKLHLDFFRHEVQVFSRPPAGVKFGKLKELRLDASSAHGDGGSTVDELLGSCENIEVLGFKWPPCDLPSCQIKGVSWGWTFPKLRQLSILGWNIAPAAYTEFLGRHPNIRYLDERIDGPYDEDGKGYTTVQLPTTALPNLSTLKKAYTYTWS
ncbi:uncharacterized protein EKO05_0005477 [Ascochyta rabiei]|uniref:Uncharacterized protein n=1 Tax=Didymella rabiei TaxID=5454 RepID=A0A163JQB5_DIDRA|nr:uncharacterized protein EKO05_0005477 [Ascochyta rabiei]KZM26513.1 hypothetical protein ST47_g2329 [Ascochyta rabiei]UPX15009.1 hypothetical protein EKO05_0005477 [Ascochyta rabiei]